MRPAQVGNWVNGAFCNKRVEFGSHGHGTTGYGGHINLTIGDLEALIEETITVNF